MHATTSRFTWPLGLSTGLLILAVATSPLAAQQTATKPAAPAKPAATVATPVVAVPQQASFDRNTIPPAGKTPVLQVPSWTRTTLANGVQLIVSEKHTLPLVSFSLTFIGGSAQYEPANRRGLAGITASMLSEGTKTRDGEALSTALQLLGTGVGVSVGAESGAIGFGCTSGNFADTAGLMADMMLNSTFPAEALERIRAQRLVSLTQAKSQPRSIASRVFPRVLYGTDHPYWAVSTEESLKAITRDDVVGFWKAFAQPARAVIIVTGDITPAAAKAVLDKALAAWPAGGAKAAFVYPPLPKAQPTTIYLVDKPGAAQSTFAIGLPGPERSTPDYYALEVMNTMLGGMFQSRLNANIREEKGLSYGVSSRFAYGRGPGAFRAGGDIISAKSDVALVEFMKELKGIGGARPVSDDELQTAKDSLVQSLPERFASVRSVGYTIQELVTDGLPDTYFQQYGAAVMKVTKDDVVRVARKYIDMEHLAIVIVGDRATIEAPLKATGIAPIVLLDIEGAVVK